MGMTINFNNVRKQALYAYDDIAKMLLASIVKQDDQYAVVPGTLHGQTMNIKGFVLIDAEDLQKRMNDLRFTLSAIGMTYEEGNPDFKDVYGEIFPGDGMLTVFDIDTDGE